MAKKTPAPKAETQAIQKWDEELAAYAEQQASTEQASGYKSVSIQGGQLTVDDNPVEGNEMNVVVLAAIHENQYYAGAFVPGAPNLPVCYAFGDPSDGDPEDTMAPHEKCPDKQHDGYCADCPKNQWGSAETGKGKACKNVRKLAIITEDALDEDLDEAEVRTLKVPVTSVKNWASYVRNKLLEVKRPCWGVVTKIKVVPDRKSQFKVTFGLESLIEFDGTLYPKLKSKVDAALKDLQAPYPEPSEEEEPAPKPRGRAPKGKKF